MLSIRSIVDHDPGPCFLSVERDHDIDQLCIPDLIFYDQLFAWRSDLERLDDILIRELSAQGSQRDALRTDEVPSVCDFVFRLYRGAFGERDGRAIIRRFHDYR